MWRTQRHQILSSPMGHGLLSVWDDTGFRTAKDGRCFGLQNVLRTRTGKISPVFSSFFFFHISHLAQTTQLQLEKILFGILHPGWLSLFQFLVNVVSFGIQHYAIPCQGVS